LLLTLSADKRLEISKLDIINLIICSHPQLDFIALLPQQDKSNQRLSFRRTLNDESVSELLLVAILMKDESDLVVCDYHRDDISYFDLVRRVLLGLFVLDFIPCEKIEAPGSDGDVVFDELASDVFFVNFYL